MPGYYISDYRQEEFAAYAFTDENGNDVTVEGRLTEIVYPLPDSSPRAVMQAIVSQGVARERLTATGFGEKNPVADNETEEGRAKNRRVELVKM